MNRYDGDIVAEKRGDDNAPAPNHMIYYIEPPENLLPYITTFYWFRSSEEFIKDYQPASIGHIMMFLKGYGVANFINDKQYNSHPISLIGSGTAAMKYEVQGPFHSFGMALSPLGWQAILKKSGKAYHDMLVNGEDILPGNIRQVYDDICAIDNDANMDDDIDKTAQKMAQLASTWFEDNQKALKPRMAEQIAKISAWLEYSLSPDLDDLYAQFNLSPRQVQRLATKYFGSPPKYLARRFRAVRAAMVLNNPLSSSDECQAVLDHFYDQPHLIKEVRHFVGPTPARLEGDNSVLSVWLEPGNVRELSIQNLLEKKEKLNDEG
ncbi:hypothetical protein LPB140_02040 [Sphingorhabdus lutea]|uniref:HTH araC/xylS-type domain-containing protein n=1 Tax=Sphingorhabdus lutea TaxID=1913578 RepID=A0A1L3J9J1_9SPHN|nr:helix-turn-helix transcriptional regulator [Sphingorhabdus lutea]APG61812.1 hypothetical protein LPB140_02040 [Sphingorhabdus lutea]